MPELLSQTGQMLISGFHGTRLNAEIEDLIINRRIGGFILFERNFESPGQLVTLLHDMQALAGTTPLGLPLFISVDQEGGRVSRLGSPFTRFPAPCCLGIAGSDDLARRFGLALGREMAAVGINMDYAPVLDVDTNPQNPIIGKRAFARQADEVARLGVEFMKGFKEAGVLAVGKHFPGHGDTELDSHLALPRVERTADTLEHVELVPFARAIACGLKAVMSAHVIYDAWDREFPATFSRPIIEGILRKRLGFDGLVISDDLEMKAVEDHYSFDRFPVLGCAAGVDVFLICHDVDKVRRLQDLLISDVESGRVARERIEASLTRITAVKKQLPPEHGNGRDLAALALSHQELVREMASYLER